MIQNLQQQITFYYIDPLAKHPIVQKGVALVAELIKIIAVKSFLEFLGKTFLLHVPAAQLKAHKRLVFESTVFAPIAEEILFRGILRKVIQVAQSVWSKWKGHELTEEDLVWQAVVRVELGALIFGAVHLFNAHDDTVSAVVQCTWSYFGGLAYGYLAEKYDTLTIGMIAHGLNNSLYIAGSKVYAQFAHILTTVTVVHKFTAHTLATTASTLQFAKRAIVETIKVVASTAFLYIAAHRLLVSQNLDSELITTAAVLIPIILEILFRGVMQQKIQQIQQGWNYVWKIEPTAVHERVQQTFRAHLGAFIFAAVHLLMPHENKVAALSQFAWAYLDGLTCVFLSEKYDSLAPGILLNGLNNTLAMMSPALNPWCNLALVGNRVAAFALATTSIDQKILAGLSQAAQFCLDLPVHLRRGSTHVGSGVVSAA